MHDKGGDHTCPHCQKYFTERNNTTKHVGQIHAQEMFYCNDCPEGSTERDQLSNHVVKHEEAFGPGKERTAVTMAHVVKDKKREIVGLATTDLETGGNKFELPVEGNFKRNKAHAMCNVCGDQYIRVEKLGDHGKKMHKECDNQTCLQCQKNFTAYPYTTKHIGPTKEETLFSCTICSKGYNGRAQLKNPGVNHPTATDFTYDDCLDQCESKDKLTKHEQKMQVVESTVRKGEPPDMHLEVLDQGNIQVRDCLVEDIDQGIQGGQDQKEEPPDMHLEVLNQWNIQDRDCLVEDIDQGIQGGQDQKEEPPDRHLEVLDQ